MPTPEMERSRALVAEHLDKLFRVAYRLTHNRHDAQDLVQDTCIAAAENMKALMAMDADSKFKVPLQRTPIRRMRHMFTPWYRVR
jgi:DNA-directed RNA polymerase specialized sigma24 family protein